MKLLSILILLSSIAHSNEHLFKATIIDFSGRYFNDEHKELAIRQLGNEKIFINWNSGNLNGKCHQGPFMGDCLTYKIVNEELEFSYSTIFGVENTTYKFLDNEKNKLQVEFVEKNTNGEVEEESVDVYTRNNL